MATGAAGDRDSMDAIPFNRLALAGKEMDYIHDAIARGQLCGDGYFTGRCNALLVEKTGAKAALITHSGTAALEMAAILCRLAPGDEVIMPSFTFVSTANAVALRGAVPVFVDIDPLTLNLDPVATAAAVTPRTRAIFAVHYAGFCADMDALAEIARAHDLLLIEDAAQALGSTFRGRPAGSLGDMAAMSFHETKNVISGEGGALLLGREDLIERAEIIREKGTNRTNFLRRTVDKYTWVDLGSSYLPGELVASFLCAQLERTDQINAQRLALYDRYTAAFAGLAAANRLSLPHYPDHIIGNGHMFFMLLNTPQERGGFIAHMEAAGIRTPFHYVPLHSSPGGLKYGRTAGPLSVTDSAAARLVRLPMFVGLDDGIEQVIAVTHDYFRRDSAARS